MKKKFLRSCFALLLSMVLLFGGVRWDAAAIGDVSPFGSVLPPSMVTFTVSAPRAVMSNEETMQMSYSATPSNGSIAWSSSNTSVATVSSSGVVTAVTGGNATITGRYTYNGSVYTDSVSIEVYTLRNSIGISNNTKYYIMNASSGRLLSLENDSDSRHANVYTRARSATTLSQWRTRKLSDGYYNIQSVRSPTGKCLDVTNNNVDIYDDNGYGYLRFTLRRVENGRYEGLYLIRHTNSGLYVTQDSNDNAYVTATPTEASYWSFMKVNKGDASHYCFDIEYTENGEDHNFDVSLNIDDFLAVIGQELGYETSHELNGEPPEAFEDLKSSEIFIYSGHCAPGELYFCDDNNQWIGSIVVDDLFYDDNPNTQYFDDISYNQLSNARCIIYMGCNSGVDKSEYGSAAYNLVDTTFEKGAHFVLGTTKSINMNDMNRWIEYFIGYIFEGYNIDQAVEEAGNDLGTIVLKDKKANGQYETYIGLPEYSVGDRYQYLNIE
ncbi:MAG: hypothetical protein E7642_07335 [Ruminococcaceae bacterium]|nr:hypothetical protein [Oscillospiraceae bacterium]